VLGYLGERTTALAPEQVVRGSCIGIGLGRPGDRGIFFGSQLLEIFQGEAARLGDGRSFWL
jgi:hypothetical protein